MAARSGKPARSATRAASSSPAPTTTSPTAQGHTPEKRRRAKDGLKLCGPRSRDEAKPIEGRKDRRIEGIGAGAEVEHCGAARRTGVDQSDEPFAVECRVQRRRAGKERDRRPARDELRLASRLQERVRDVRCAETRA